MKKMIYSLISSKLRLLKGGAFLCILTKGLLGKPKSVQRVKGSGGPPSALSAGRRAGTLRRLFDSEAVRQDAIMTE